MGALAAAAAALGVPAQARAVAKLRGIPVPGSGALAMAVLPIAGAGLAAAFLGSALGPAAGVPLPLLDPQTGVSLARVAGRQMATGLLGGLAAAAVVFPLYYARLRPLLGAEAFRVSETLRRGMGLRARLAIGGVWEEIFFRFGVLSLGAWLGARAAGSVTPAVEWAATLAAALAFGAAHLPGIAVYAGRVGARAVALSLLLNGWLGVVAGWLVWREGLGAAIVAHSSVHVLWAVVERVRGE